MLKSTEFLDLLSTHRFQIVEDPASVVITMDRYPVSNGSLKEGYFIFMEEPRRPTSDFISKFYLVAKAICFLKIDGDYFGHIDTFNVTNLISSLSTKLDVNNHPRKGSTLYGRPLIDDPDEWNQLKIHYIKDNIIEKAIQVISCEKANSIKWKFVEENDDLPFLKGYYPTDRFTEFLKSEEFAFLNEKLSGIR